MMRLRTAFRDAVTFLETRGIQDAYFEARCLLSMIGIESIHLYSSPERTLTDHELEELKRALTERSAGRPSAYITRKREFFGLELYVDERVMIPRPETEIVVEKALEHASQHGDRILIADIGTGSGAIAIALAKNLPKATVFATDISKAALEVAALNAARHGVADRINFLHGDLLEPLPEPVNLITANLPYVPHEEIRSLPREISDNEPLVAIDGGRNGLEVLSRFLKQIMSRILPTGCVVIEIGFNQSKAIMEMADACLPRTARKELFRDANGLDRVIRLVL